MSVKLITSRDNPTYRQLFDLANERAVRRAAGQTLLDGEHLLQSALDAGVVPRWLILSESAQAGPLAAWPERLARTSSLLLPDKLFQRLTPVASPTGLLAVIDLPRPVEAPAGSALLLEDIQDPGNLGAILRSAAAAGVEGVYLSPGCAEAWSPKCLRGGQGAHFRLALHEGQDLVALAGRWPGPVYAASLQGAARLYDLDLSVPLAFAFGNEGAGLSAELLAVTQPFRIPMHPGVESLNVAAAAAVCLFERLRQLG